MASFFRFLSKRAKSSTESKVTRHKKLQGCEDLKEALESLNKRPSAPTPNAMTKNDLSGQAGASQANQAHLTQSHRLLSFKSLQKHTQSSQQASKEQRKKQIECAVIFLDGSEYHFFIDKKSPGGKLYESVHYHLDLVETDYFGLQYTDTHNVQHWLEPSKAIRKQCKIGPPYTFFFKVKFYTAEPNNLREEITRYFYFLQIKNDLRSGKLAVTRDVAVELAALSLQEELGDYESHSHSIDTVSEFRFVPEGMQSEEFEEAVLDYYKTKCTNLTPAEAELTYLNKAKWLEMYGVDMHLVYGRDENEYRLGLTPSGILVFESEQKIGLFYWPKIERIAFSKKKFTIIVSEDDDRGFKQEHTFIFHLIDEKACKHLWKCAVEYHAFFRLRATPKDAHSGLSGFIRRGSRFKGPHRTEFQTTNLNTISTRRSVHFERRPSQRFSRRASYAIKRKMQEQQKSRDTHGPNAEVPVANGDGGAVGADGAAAPPPPNTSRAAQRSHVNSSAISGHCCKLNATSHGLLHEEKCNVFKAQQYVSGNATATAATSSAKANGGGAAACAKEASSPAGEKPKCVVDDDDDGVESAVHERMDRNEQLSDEDDKAKLIDKEMISVLTSSVKKVKRGSPMLANGEAPSAGSRVTTSTSLSSVNLIESESQPMTSDSKSHDNTIISSSIVASAKPQKNFAALITEI